MPTLTQTEIDAKLDEEIRQNAAVWAYAKGVKVGGNRFDLSIRPYLKKFFLSSHPRRGAMKAPQEGWTMAAILEAIHGLIYHLIPCNVLHLFPTEKDMLDYSKSNIDPLIKSNPTAIGKYVKSGGKGTDTAGLKKIGHGYYFCRGAKLNPTEAGGASSARLSGIPAGHIIYDEVDFMDAKVFADARGRQKSVPEAQRREVFLANPSSEDYGIDLLWQRSDMEWLYHPCTCGHKVCPTREFLDDPEKLIGIYPDLGSSGENLGYIRCKKCGKPVSVLNCEYIPDWPQRTEYEFQQVSQLSFINSNPARILNDYRTTNDMAGFYKNELGLPYSSAEEKLTKHAVLSCCGREGMPENHHGPCAMGVDNDDNKHVVVGIRTSPEKYEVLKAARLDNFNAVYDLIRKFNIKFGVVDMKPNKDSATQFQKAASSAGCKIFLCDYTDSPLQDVNFNENTGICKVYRTGIFDTTHRIISNGDVVLPRQSPTIDEFARQCCNCAKQKDEKRKDVVIYRYVKTGDGADHYRNAFNYFVTAAGRVQKVARFVSQRKGLKFCECKDVEL